MDWPGLNIGNTFLNETVLASNNLSYLQTGASLAFSFWDAPTIFSSFVVLYSFWMSWSDSYPVLGQPYCSIGLGWITTSLSNCVNRMWGIETDACSCYICYTACAALFGFMCCVGRRCAVLRHPVSALRVVFSMLIVFRNATFLYNVYVINRKSLFLLHNLFA